MNLFFSEGRAFLSVFISKSVLAVKEDNWFVSKVKKKVNY